ncbi:DUF4159 domain-containing protein [Paracoccus pacificus]|uniref:DUF4159 domain-containing protein n=1 Tax=Paracoccus pacificus TaxID=1463598 RepID=A0ABW4R527_9RHOB
MFTLGALGFASPWILTALVALPALWVILRAMPPGPRLVSFPAVGLLLGLRDKRPEARRTPWWLLLLRMLAVAALILAFAGPVWRPAAQPGGTGPMLLVVDAGWSAAPNWQQTQRRMVQELEQAAGRPVAVLLADGRADDAALAFAAGPDLVRMARAARPVAWPGAFPEDPQKSLSAAPKGELQTLWLSDGADHPNRGRWMDALVARGSVTVVPPTLPVLSLQLAGPEGNALTLHGVDPNATAEAVPKVVALGPDPQGIERDLAVLTPGEAAADGDRPVAITLQPELRNRVTRFQVQAQDSAGAVVLADDRVRRRKVALVGSTVANTEGQALLSPLHYLRRALAPTTELSEGGLSEILPAAPDVIILADEPPGGETAQLAEWVQAGGTLIRFAGPRMAAAERVEDDPLLPVRLRAGGRDIGGALSWGDPRALAPFSPDGPFAGLVPPDEVTVRAQIMAEPSPELAQATIAALSDNTPLVTRAARGDGQVILFHVTANAEWSSLPLSGLFVQMLNRLVQSARGMGEVTDQAAPEAHLNATEPQADFWTAESLLDGFGRPVPPEGLAPVPNAQFSKGLPGPEMPAGLYRAGERVHALNAGTKLAPAVWPATVRMEQAARAPGLALRGWLLALAAALMALDALASVLVNRARRGGGGVGGGVGGGTGGNMGGNMGGGAPAGAVAAIVLLVLAGVFAPMPAHAQEPPAATAEEVTPDPDPRLLKAADEVALAYVVTGDPAVDRAAEAGLKGLSQGLAARTTVEPGAPIGVDLDVDDLSVLTFLYWPITDTQPAPSPAAYVRLNRFLRTGGLILFDTRDADIAGTGAPDQSAALQRLAAPLEIPALAPVPQDHVLTRTFYLLDYFPGRFDNGEVWAEAPPPDAVQTEGVPFRHLNDGVSPVIIGGNDWAGAWAIDDRGLPMFTVGRGYDGERQREMALRFGINLIMYVLTGNYKSDQVHVPALLERLRQDEIAPQPRVGQ